MSGLQQGLFHGTVQIGARPPATEHKVHDDTLKYAAAVAGARAAAARCASTYLSESPSKTSDLNDVE